jgi:FlaA1/EpsC-like NDP-sugar epimerase
MPINNRGFLDNTWDKFLEFQKGRRLILFGVTGFIGEFLENYLTPNNIVPAYIVDNDPNRWGTYLYNMKIYEPQKILSEKKDTYVVLITAQQIYSTQSQLEEMDITDYFAMNLFFDLWCNRRRVDIF